MGIKSLPRLLLIYSVVVLVLLIIIASNVDVEVKRLRREDQDALPRGKLIIREDPGQIPKETGSVVPPSDTEGPVRAVHKCEMVHLAFVVENLRTLITQVVKSVLIYRHCPLHLHFVVDQFNQTILQRLLHSWELPYVEYSIYSTHQIRQNLTLLPTLLTSDVLKISKILLPYILPRSLDYVIFLDSELLVVSDIQELWELASELNEQKKLFAVSKASSLQGHFDTKVMILNLNLMRSSNWDQLCQSVVKKSPRVNYNGERVINAIIVSYPDAFSVLPCSWNIDEQNQLACVQNASDYRIVQLSSSTLSGDSGYAQQVSQLETFVKDYSSPSLRNVPRLCDKNSKAVPEMKKERLPPLPRRSRREMCRLISKEKERVFVTHLYYYGYKYEPRDDFETTLVTQLSLDRLDKFHLLLNHWDGPISMAMYGTDAQAWNLTKYMELNEIRRDNLVIHVVYKQGRFYPVNHLRNLALDTTNTPYVFLSDGDFLPIFGLFNHLKKANKMLMTGEKKRALVIPAFNGEGGFQYPNNKKELQVQLKQGSVRMFCVWCAHQTHGPTNYTVWANATHPYKVEWAFHFEPYVVVRRDVARYDERFVGYGWNKVSQITELKAQGYDFVVLPQVFTIHSPHKRTSDREIWKRKNYKFCINSLWKRFIQDLLQKYGPDCLKENKAAPVMIKVEI